MSASENLSTKCSGFLLRSSFAILAASTRHLISVARMAAFSVASRLSSSSDILLRASSEPPLPWVACSAHQVQRCRGRWGHGFAEQIFGADEQDPRRRRRHLRSVRPWVLQSGKGRIAPSIRSAYTRPGRQLLGPFPSKGKACFSHF